MKSIKINKINYVSFEEISKEAPIYCKSIRNGRELIKKKQIDKENFIYAKLNDSDEWEKSDGKSIKYDKVFVKKSYLNTIDNLQKEINGETVSDENGIEKAPEIIELNDNEKFKDENGNVLEIETRGEREHDKIYFKVKDVEKSFEMKSLYATLIGGNASYVENKDYIYFICEFFENLKNKTNKNKTNKNNTKKELFLTYSGMLHVLFASHSGKASQFTKWAAETLFTVQMGTKEQKNILASKILGASIETVNNVFDTSANTLPVIYLFSLGYVKNLRHIMKIPDKYNDDMIILIYGCTKDFQRRTNEHDKFYKKIKGIELKLKCHAYVDPQYIFKAETDVSEYMNDMNCKFSYEKEKEMIILDENKLKKVHKRYEELSKIYMGHIREIMMEKERLETKVREIQDKMIIQGLQKDLEIEKMKSQLSGNIDTKQKKKIKIIK